LNALQPANGGGFSDAFVTKINPAGTALVYSTYLGGSGDDRGRGLAVDSAGNAYVIGTTMSTDFPTQNALQPANGSGLTAFVTKINALGSALVYSTYLGGSIGEDGQGIAADSVGNAYVTGVTASTDFPTKNPLQPALNGYADAFVSKINPAGSALVYSTYLGGSLGDTGYGIAVDSTGNAYITGFTESTDFPTKNPLQAALNGEANAFVSKINPTGLALVYSTYLGGSGADFGAGIAVDRIGRAYVTGPTSSTDFPTKNPLQAALDGDGDAFVSKLNRAGSALVYSTYLGGSGGDGGSGIAVDSAGDAYVTGRTNSTDFPTKNPLQPTYGGGDDDAFLAKLNPTGRVLVYSTYLGGSGFDGQGSGIAVGSTGDVYLSGATNSNHFPTKKPLQAANAGGFDAFVVKIDVRAVTTTTLSSSPNPSTYGQAVTFTAVVTSSLGAPPDGETVAFVKGTTVLGTGVLTGGSAIFTTSTLPVGIDYIKAVYGGDLNFGGSASKWLKQVVNKPQP
jgi:hypothetical protein